MLASGKPLWWTYGHQRVIFTTVSDANTNISLGCHVDWDCETHQACRWDSTPRVLTVPSSLRPWWPRWTRSLHHPSWGGEEQKRTGCWGHATEGAADKFCETGKYIFSPTLEYQWGGSCIEGALWFLSPDYNTPAWRQLTEIALLSCLVVL